MRRTTIILALVVLAAVASAFPCAAAPTWTDQFALDKKDLSSVGRSPYFVLEPGYQLVYKGQDSDLVITVLNETKMIDGVETRIVEERESESGKLVEVSRNYFAISKASNTVFYFGEDVDMYGADGKVTGHGGSWHAGENSGRAGVAVPALALLGARYYQEVAPKVAMDRAEIVSVSETLKTPAGSFMNVVRTEETSPLEPGVKEYKYYAPGIGLLKDGDFLLVRYGIAK